MCGEIGSVRDVNARKIRLKRYMCTKEMCVLGR